MNEGADELSVFIVSTDQPIALEHCFGIGQRLAFRHVNRRPGDRVRQLLNRDVPVITHVAKHHRA